MNSTCWVTLTSFVKHLGRTGKAIIDETEKGWYVTWVQKDQETLEREKKTAKKERMMKDDEEKVRDYIDAQIEKAKAQSTLDESDFDATELLKAEDEQLKLDLKMKNFNKVQESGGGELKNVFRSVPAPSASKDKDKEKVDTKRKMSALEEIMEQGKKKKALDEIMEKEKKKKKKDESDPKDRSWLRKSIVVKVVTKSLGDKYYKKKGYVKEVIDDFAALVVISETGAKVKLDQDHLETVIPQEGREVVLWWGQCEGETATLRSIDTEKFSASLKVESGKFKGEKLKLPYEQFSKKYVE